MSQKRSTRQDAPGGGAGLGDDEGTRVGAPEASPKAPDQHSDAPSGRAERQTGTGSEATEGMHNAQADGSRSEGDQHRSGYGGAGGTPVTSSDTREPTKKR